MSIWLSTYPTRTPNLTWADGSNSPLLDPGGASAVSSLYYGIISPIRPCLGNRFASLRDLSDELMYNNDIHIRHLTQWIGSGHWGGILRTQWTHDQQTGHYGWDADNTAVGGGYEPDQPLTPCNGAIYPVSTPRFHTGSTNDMFNDQIHDMLQMGKFNLLTRGVPDSTKVQYMACWKRWDQYCNCLNISPWLPTALRGWGEPLIYFLDWGRVIFGLQHSIIAQRLYAVRFLHVAEGYDDLAMRGEMAKSITKAVKKRGGGVCL